jgi:hypothetical protein
MLIGTPILAVKFARGHVRYLINPGKVADFERYAKLWIPIVRRLGGTHHGHFLPHEGANNVALCLLASPL